MTAACLRNGLPSTARAEITLPSSSSKTSTVTIPAARTDLAPGGYCGLGRLMALLLSTPPDNGLDATADGSVAAADGAGFVVKGEGVEVEDVEVEAGGLAFAVDVLFESGAGLGVGCGGAVVGSLTATLLSAFFSSLLTTGCSVTLGLTLLPASGASLISEGPIRLLRAGKSLRFSG